MSETGMSGSDPDMPVSDMRMPSAPGRGEDAQPVLVAQLPQSRLVPARVAERVEEERQRLHAAQLGRKGRAVEVRAEGNVVDADPLGDVVSVAHDIGEGRVRVVPAVVAEEARGEVDADDTTGCRDR